MLKKVFLTSLLFSHTLSAQRVLEVPAPISKIFSIEEGFDNNDNVEVIVSGYLPDTCHQLGRTEVHVNHEDKKISIKATAYLQQDRSCLQVRTPYLETVHIGILDIGSYDIEITGENSFQSQIKIDKSYHSQQDNELYAPIQTVSLEQNNNKVLLKGKYPYVLEGCMVITDIKTQRFNDILIVLPIASVTKDENLCRREDETFSLEVEIDDDLKANNGLVYVRTTSGRSKSLFID